MSDKIDKTPDPKAEAGSKKNGFSYVPLSAMISLSIGMKAGVPKYGEKNWYTASGHKMCVYLDAIQRHWLLLMAGEDYVRDAEGLVHHLDAIIGGASVLKDLLIFDKCMDDRTKMSDDQLNKFAAQVSGEDYAKLPIKHQV